MLQQNFILKSSWTIFISFELTSSSSETTATGTTKSTFFSQTYQSDLEKKIKNKNHGEQGISVGVTVKSRDTDL